MEKTARRKDSDGRSLGLKEEYYLRKRISDSQGRYFFGGGSLHAPELVFTTDEADRISGATLDTMAWDWSRDWEAVSVKRPSMILPSEEGPREASSNKRVTANIRPEDLLMHQIEEYPTAETLAVIQSLGEESIAGFSPVQEDEVFEVLAICSVSELGEILRGLQSRPAPITAQSDSMIKTAQASDPLQGMTNTRARKFVNDLIRPFTAGFFKDDSWKPVHEIFNALRQSGIDFDTYLPSGRVSDYTQNENGVPISKEWWFTVKFINAANRETILYGHIQASGAGTVQYPLDRYDLTAIVS